MIDFTRDEHGAKVPATPQEELDANHAKQWALQKQQKALPPLKLPNHPQPMEIRDYGQN